jgi:hypothetical protein
MRKIDWELTETVGKWMKHVYGNQNKRTRAMSGQWSSTSPDTGMKEYIIALRSTYVTHGFILMRSVRDLYTL